MKIAVVGLGKLGAPLAAVLASKGNDVLGIDVVPEVVRRLEDGLAPVQEPGLQELVAANRKRLNATTELEAAAECDMTILLGAMCAAEALVIAAVSSVYLIGSRGERTRLTSRVDLNPSSPQAA